MTHITKVDHKKVEVKKMKMKILIGIGILFLLMGTVAAFEISELKTIEGYNDFDDGFSNYTTNNNRYFCVEKTVSSIDDIKNEYFTNSTEFKLTVIPVEDNIWYIEDDTFEYYGYQEIVNIDGDDYMVSINQNSKLSPSEKNSFLSDLKEFNKLNSLEPIAI